MTRHNVREISDKRNTPEQVPEPVRCPSSRSYLLRVRVFIRREEVQ